MASDRNLDGLTLQTWSLNPPDNPGETRCNRVLRRCYFNTHGEELNPNPWPRSTTAVPSICSQSVQERYSGFLQHPTECVPCDACVLARCLTMSHLCTQVVLLVATSLWLSKVSKTRRVSRQLSPLSWHLTATPQPSTGSNARIASHGLVCLATVCRSKANRKRIWVGQAESRCRDNQGKDGVCSFTPALTLGQLFDVQSKSSTLPIRRSAGHCQRTPKVIRFKRSHARVHLKRWV